MPDARSNLVLQEVQGETLVYDPQARVTHLLAPPLAFIFRHCSARFSLAEVALDLGEETVRGGLQALADKGLLASATGRRAFLGQLVKAAAVPAVLSVAAPNPAAAASCPGPGPANPCATVANCCPGLGCFGPNLCSTTRYCQLAIQGACSNDPECGNAAGFSDGTCLVCCTSGPGVGLCRFPNTSPCFANDECCSGNCTGFVCV